MSDNIEINKKRHARRSRRRKTKPNVAKSECICQELMEMLSARLDMIEKNENKQYEVPGICICPEHKIQKFIAFYVRNTRDVDLSGFMTGDDNHILGYMMH
jgi:hypothetical protein